MCGIRVNLTLINSGGQLTDNEINGAQRMLQAQHPALGGLQDTLLGLTRSLLSCAVVNASRHEMLVVRVQAGCVSSKSRPLQGPKYCMWAPTIGRPPFWLLITTAKAKCFLQTPCTAAVSTQTRRSSLNRFGPSLLCSLSRCSSSAEASTAASLQSHLRRLRREGKSWKTCASARKACAHIWWRASGRGSSRPFLGNED